MELGLGERVTVTTGGGSCVVGVGTSTDVVSTTDVTSTEVTTGGARVENADVERAGSSDGDGVLEIVGAGVDSGGVGSGVYVSCGALEARGVVAVGVE